MKGLGTDIVEVDRIASKIEKNASFRTLVFSAHEIEYCESQSKKFEHYAARFAAKEAFLKALGTGWAGSKTNFNEIEIRNDAAGKPELYLLGASAQIMESLNISSIHVSLSHVKSMATATVIIL